jgi:hypothetical protein
LISFEPHPAVLAAQSFHSEVPMVSIGLKGVIVGGLVAGVVLNVIDYVLYGVVLARDFADAMQALGKPPTDSLVPLFVLLDFIYGIILIYLYASIRPRFGPGPKTAIWAGFLMWVLVTVLHAVGEAPLGLLPMRLYLIGIAVSLIGIPLAALAGARFYKEPA